MTDKSTTGRKPEWKLLQDKAYYHIDKSGNRTRKTDSIEITVGWMEVSQDGKKYLSWADSVVPVLPDADGRVRLYSIQINNDE